MPKSPRPMQVVCYSRTISAGIKYLRYLIQARWTEPSQAKHWREEVVYDFIENECDVDRPRWI